MRAAKSERASGIAQQLVSTTQSLAEILEAVNDEEWERPVPSDGRTVGIVARHVVDVHALGINIASSVSAGGRLPTWESIHEWNAQMAKIHAGCRRAETIRLLRQAASSSVEAIERFTDDQLEVTTRNHEDQTRSVADLLHILLVAHTSHHARDIQGALSERPQSAGHARSEVTRAPAPTNRKAKRRVVKK